MATVYGSGTYGLADESTGATGLYASDITLDASLEEAFVPNHEGDDIGVALFNEQASITANGVLSTANDLPLANLGKAPTMAANNAAIHANITLVTEFWIASENITGANRDFQTGSWTANGRKGITSITASS